MSSPDHPDVQQNKIFFHRCALFVGADGRKDGVLGESGMEKLIDNMG